jgi:hypothetical protein
MKNILKLRKSVLKSDTNNTKKDLIELLLNWEWEFLEKFINLNLTKEQYNNFDLLVKNTYSIVWYNYKWKLEYSLTELDIFLYKLSLNTLSFWDYLVYFTFKTEDEQFWYFYISLLEWTTFFDNEDLTFLNKNEFYKFIKKYIIEQFFLKIDGLEEVKTFIWKNESTKPINNTNLELKQLAA